MVVLGLEVLRLVLANSDVRGCYHKSRHGVALTIARLLGLHPDSGAVVHLGLGCLALLATDSNDLASVAKQVPLLGVLCAHPLMNFALVSRVATQQLRM